MKRLSVWMGEDKDPSSQPLLDRVREFLDAIEKLLKLGIPVDIRIAREQNRYFSTTERVFFKPVPAGDTERKELDRVGVLTLVTRAEKGDPPYTCNSTGPIRSGRPYARSRRATATPRRSSGASSPPGSSGKPEGRGSRCHAMRSGSRSQAWAPTSRRGSAAGECSMRRVRTTSRTTASSPPSPPQVSRSPRSSRRIACTGSCYSQIPTWPRHRASRLREHDGRKCASWRLVCRRLRIRLT